MAKGSMKYVINVLFRKRRPSSRIKESSPEIDIFFRHTEHFRKTSHAFRKTENGHSLRFLQRNATSKSAEQSMDVLAINAPSNGGNLVSVPSLSAITRSPGWIDGI
jgi:hypothetical protein